MIGKTLKIKDINMSFKQKAQYVSVFACFSHLKYNESYIIYSKKDEYNKGILYMGTIHIKNDSIIIFDVKEEKQNIILDFVNKLISNEYHNEYSVIDISNINDIEIVSVSSRVISTDIINNLDNLTIEKPKIDKASEEKNETLAYLYFTLFIFIGLFACAIYFVLNQDKYFKPDKNVICTLSSYSEEVKANYEENVYLTFSKGEDLSKINRQIKYTFDSETEYNYFKYNNLWSEFNIVSYKFDDDNKTFIYNDNFTTLITQYDELINYYTDLDYNCSVEE